MLEVPANTQPAPPVPERREMFERLAARWILPADNLQAAASLQTDLGVHSVIARILVARGFIDPLGAKDFLRPQLSALHDPFLMLDMERAVSRLQTALRDHERVLLYGDYDVDGTSSVVVLKKALEI